MRTNDRAPLSDAAIVDLYWQRDEQAIRETDRKYSRYLSTVADSILHDRSDTEECLSDTYLRAWNAMPPDRPQFLQAYLAKIIRRLSLDRIRAAARRGRVSTRHTVALEELTESLASGESAEAAYEASVISHIINRYLATLTERDRTVFICRYFCADTLPDIAAQVGLSRGGVRKALERLREGLRTELEKEGITL